MQQPFLRVSYNNFFFFGLDMLNVGFTHKNLIQQLITKFDNGVKPINS